MENIEITAFGRYLDETYNVTFRKEEHECSISEFLFDANRADTPNSIAFPDVELYDGATYTFELSPLLLRLWGLPVPQRKIFTRADLSWSGFIDEFDRLLKESGDFHRYLESINSYEAVVDGVGVTVIQLNCGS